MSEQQIFTVAIIFFLFLSSGILGYYIRVKHKERLELIKKGDFMFEPNYFENLKYSILSKAIILISLAIGFGIAYKITINMPGEAQVVVYLISLLLSSGAGLLLYYFILQKKVK